MIPSFKHLLVIDIETVPMVFSFDELSDQWKELWDAKMSFIREKQQKDNKQLWLERAGVYAEFSKVICIGWGFLQLGDEATTQLSVCSHQEESEADLLKEWVIHMNKVALKKGSLVFAGHNIQEFDLPFICRRLLANRLGVPSFLPKPDTKPWDVRCLDTLKWWRFGDYKQYISLDLLASTLGIASSKKDIDGSMVSSVYHKEKDIEKVSVYCKNDVIAASNVCLAFLQKPGLQKHQITYF